MNPAIALATLIIIALTGVIFWQWRVLRKHKIHKPQHPRDPALYYYLEDKDEISFLQAEGFGNAQIALVAWAGATAVLAAATAIAGAASLTGLNLTFALLVLAVAIWIGMTIFIARDTVFSSFPEIPANPYERTAIHRQTLRQAADYSRKAAVRSAALLVITIILLSIAATFYHRAPQAVTAVDCKKTSTGYHCTLP